MQSEIMKRLQYAMVGITCLSACASDYDRINATKFVPTKTGFVFQAYADAARPIHDPKSEVIRMQWLQEFISKNDMCPNGYTIKERRDVLVSEGMFGDIYDVYYFGTCK